MPPAKRASKSKATAAAAGPPVAVLLARCSRGALEALLEESVANAKPVTAAMIAATLPEAKQQATIARPVVKSGPVREGTGYFDLLDEEVLVKILSMVGSTATQLTCLIAVCKAWREGELRSRVEIFSSIALCPAHGHSWRLCGGSALNIASSKVPRLLQFLPDVSAVRTLALDAGEKKTCARGHRASSPECTESASRATPPPPQASPPT